VQFNIRFSQGSAATYFRCIGRSYTIFICISSAWECDSERIINIGPD